MGKRYTIVAAAAACLVGSVLGNAQEPTFRGANRTVAVYATVTDQSGRLVPDLTRDAFSIQENGKPQPLTLFANEIQPITVVVLLDRSTSMRANFGLVQKAAERFVDVMRPEDKARIGSFSDRVEVDPRDFTSDHETLLTILRTDLQEGGPTPLWNAINVGITALLHQEGRRVVLVDATERLRSLGESYAGLFGYCLASMYQIRKGQAPRDFWGQRLRYTREPPGRDDWQCWAETVALVLSVACFAYWLVEVIDAVPAEERS